MGVIPRSKIRKQIQSTVQEEPEGQRSGQNLKRMRVTLGDDEPLAKQECCPRSPQIDDDTFYRKPEMKRVDNKI